MKLFRLFSLTSLILCTTACTGSSTTNQKGGSSTSISITVAQASQRSSALLGDMAHDASKTAKATIDLDSVENTAELLEDFVNLFADSGDEESATAEVPQSEEDTGSPENNEGEENEDWDEEDWGEEEGDREDSEDEEEEFSPEEFANDIRKIITEDLLIDGNLETINGDTATFLIRGENICEKIEVVDYDQNGNETWSEEVDTECIESIDEAQVRIEAKLLGEDGIELKVLVGAERVQVFLITSEPNSLTVDVYLAGLKDAIEVFDGGDDDGEGEDHASSSDSSEAPDADGPGDTPDDEEWEEFEEEEGFETEIKSAEGVVRLAITINGDQDATASINITETIQVVLEDDEKTVTISVGESNPLFNIHAQPLLGMVALAFDLNNLDLSAPMSLLAEDTATGEIFAHLAGIQFEVDLDDSAESVTFTNVGLGDSQSTLKYNETTILALDLNESVGRSFNFQLNDVGDDIHLTLTPEFVLSAAFYFQPVAQMFDDMPDFLMDETISIRASGESGATLTSYRNEENCGGPEISAPSEEAPPENEYCDHVEGLKVIGGTLELDSTKADNPLVANSNQCITGDGEPRANESHELLRELSVISCE